MKIKYSLLFILAIILFTALKPFAQTAVVTPSTKAILFKGGIAHLGNGRVIENSLIGIKDGKIILITDAATARIDGSVFDERITITGKHVYPGIIAPSSTIGLNELDAVRATNDFSEVGYINPHVRSLISYNTDSKIIPTIRTNGILLVQASPRGGLISGSSSIMKLDGWNWEDAVLKADDGIHLNWPEMNAPKIIRETDQSYNERVKNYNTSISNVTNFFADAKAYSQIVHDEKNIRFEAMKGIITGEKILYVHTNSLKDIIELIAFTKKFEIKKYVLVGARDAYLATAILKENNVPVILAMRMSIGIPLIYTPVMFENDYYVDGGLTNNVYILENSNPEKTLIIHVNKYKPPEILSIKDILLGSIFQKRVSFNFMPEIKSPPKNSFKIFHSLLFGECHPTGQIPL